MATKTTEQKQEYVNNKILQGKVDINIVELFEFIDETKKREDKIKALKSNKNKAILEIIRLTYGNIEKLLTGKEVRDIVFENVDTSNEFVAPMKLIGEYKRLSIYTNERGSGIRKSKLIILMSQLLSCLWDKEREIVYNIFEGKLKYNGLTEKLCKEAFPELFVGDE